MDQVSQIINQIGAHVVAILAVLFFIHRFLNNLLVKVPSLKSNTWFECITNTVDALVVTIKNRADPAPIPDLETVIKQAIADFASAQPKL